MEEEAVRNYIVVSSGGLYLLKETPAGSNEEPMSRSLNYLKEITGDFADENILGEGGFGVVYKGVVPSGQVIAAVKKLHDKYVFDDKMFLREVSFLIEAKHQYIVQLVGYCAETSSEQIELEPGVLVPGEKPKRLICMEYVRNGSLDQYISAKSSSSEWSERYEIIQKICMGLQFLHDKCRIVHLDLKPQNILMDADWTPKIADFGLAMRLDSEQPQTVTDFVGTAGYMAPEIIEHQELSPKTDIFSLGVIIIEIITGHKSYPYNYTENDNSDTSFKEFAEKVVGSWTDKFKSTPFEEKYTTQQVRECIDIALKCVDHRADNRPDLKYILEKLDAVHLVQDDSDDSLGIYIVDEELAKFKDHFSYTMKRYRAQKRLLEQNEGSLEEFSKGYLKFGINIDGDATVYREWAQPVDEVKLYGDFNKWNDAKHKMKKDKFGVWSIEISHVNGEPAIPHNSKVKFRFRHGDKWSDRIPAWIRYVTYDSNAEAHCDGVHWDPPASSRYVFLHSRPQKPDGFPRIYVAHLRVSGEKLPLVTYREFANYELPRIMQLPDNYNTIQLTGIMAQYYCPNYGGYHVKNLFAVSSRYGTPEDLKYLVDRAHILGFRVLMDVDHSQASTNVLDGLNGYDFGQKTQDSYFHDGRRGYLEQRNSRMFNYANWEVLRFLLSNLRYWMDEFRFDGFRFNGVTSMLYHHHGIDKEFTGDYKEYFSLDTDVDAVVYMMLANYLMHKLFPEATIIAEDVSGMPVLCLSVDDGGVGFDYRQDMSGNLHR